jgi:AcrR family transcriptional regulator
MKRSQTEELAPLPGGVTSGDRPKGSLVARKQRRIRQALALTALELFTEQGYDQTTVEEIVDRVEISMSTFYRFFPSKSDLILELHHIGSRDLVRVVAERPPEESLAQALEAALAQQQEELEQDLPALRHFEELLAKNPELRGRLLADQYSLRDAMAEAIAPRLGARPADLRCQVVAIAILATTHVALELWSADSADSADSAGGAPVDSIRSAFGVLEPLLTTHD